MYHDPPSALRIARRIGWEIKSDELLVVDGGRNQYKHVTVMLVWGRWKGIKVTLNLVSAVFQRISTVEQRDPHSKTRGAGSGLRSALSDHMPYCQEWKCGNASGEGDTSLVDITVL